MEAASGGYHEVGKVLIECVSCTYCVYIYIYHTNKCLYTTFLYVWCVIIMVIWYPVQLLSFLKQGADVNALPVPTSRDTALTIASDKGHFKFVELILNYGANVDVKNKKGNSPLWLACNGKSDFLVSYTHCINVYASYLWINFVARWPFWRCKAFGECWSRCG